MQSDLGKDFSACFFFSAASPEQSCILLYFVKAIKSKQRYQQRSIHGTEARRHQIRLHLAAAGFPVLGDDTYGGSGADAKR